MVVSLKAATGRHREAGEPRRKHRVLRRAGKVGDGAVCVAAC